MKNMLMFVGFLEILFCTGVVLFTKAIGLSVGEAILLVASCWAFGFLTTFGSSINKEIKKHEKK